MCRPGIDEAEAAVDHVGRRARHAEIERGGRESAHRLVELAALAEPGQHEGDEWIYVLSGELVLEVDGRPTRGLGPGDAADYEANHSHSFRNASTIREAQIICVNSPPNL